MSTKQDNAPLPWKAIGNAPYVDIVDANNNYLFSIPQKDTDTLNKMLPAVNSRTALVSALEKANDWLPGIIALFSCDDDLGFHNVAETAKELFYVVDAALAAAKGEK
jgi:hypothetical protein